ncbi:MAG: ABC transporter permease, partial [Verrucomicrobiota bacterium]
EALGARRVVVISHRLWGQIFDRDPQVIGKKITLENAGRHSYEIIGVMPEGFRQPAADVWVSCAHMPQWPARRGGAQLLVVARLKPGVSLARAQAELNTIQARIHSEYGHLEQKGQYLAMGSQTHLQPLLETTVSNVRPSLFIFSGAVALVLLIACANVANLLLSRALSRQREVAVRTALGASRWRIVRQLLCESVLLALVGGIAGTLLAYGGTRLVVQFSAGSIPRIDLVQIDWRVLLFTLAVSLGTGFIFGLAPAWQSSKADLNEALKEGGGRVSGGLAHQRLRSLFTVAQVALALMLLIGAGLLMRSFHRLQAVETGFDTEELLTVDVTMTGASYDQPAKRRIFLQQLMDNLRAVPGVQAVCAVSMIPDRGSGWPTEYARTDRPMAPLAQRPQVGVRVVTPDYLKTYGIRLLRGREFTESDATAAGRVLLVNQAFADAVYPGEDPVGKQLDCGGRAEIIGIVANVKNTGLTGETRPEIYGTYQQWPFQSVFLTVRAASNPQSLAPVITEQVRLLNPDQPLIYFRTIQNYLDEATARPRFRSLVIGVFALVALMLASVGIYGVMAYAVAQRTNEIGIRMALGAQRTDVLHLVIRQGMQLTLIGVALGLAGSLALSRVLEAHLFAISTTDTTTFLGVALLLTFVALAACFIPALRAMRVNPMVALRNE